MEQRTEGPRIFSLDEARQLLPTVKRLTAEAVRESEQLVGRARQVRESDPRHEALVAELQEVVSRWAADVRELGAEVKGLWLVDFDNGQGYYCWSYPEETLSHYHSYEDGFAGRMKIM